MALLSCPPPVCTKSHVYMSRVPPPGLSFPRICLHNGVKIKKLYRLQEEEEDLLTTLVPSSVASSRETWL